ncbi:hypothetical protein ACFVDI_02445 [Nocardioides sp. NPDC057767]|uniref:hypothetical protein n=1 Tax=unclassified Nocardioides TaxID=2615069 RepID=UPI003671D1BE
MASERKRREAAYEASVAAVLAYLEGEDADLYNLLDEAAKTDALAAAYRLTYLAARTAEELADRTGETPSDVLNRIIQEKHR